MNCGAYSTFEGMSSDHRIVIPKIRLSLQKMLNNRDISDKYTLTLRNKFDALQEIIETLTPIDEYENFLNAHREVAVECIPTKQRAKPRFSWETLAVRRKRLQM